MDRSAPISRDAAPAAVRALADARVAAKKAKDWAMADDLRAQMTAMGFAIKDLKGEADPYEFHVI